jgi:GTP-binding protein
MAGDNFIDYVKIFFRSGNGGGGSAHLMRTAQDPKAGPDGGDGGKGGDVVLVGNRNLWTLLHLRYTKHIFAENGGNGSSNQKFGKNGDDAVVEVPLGTVTRNPETGEVLGEVMEDGERLTIMRGGRGGLGNVHFKSATRQTPRFAQPGEEGVEGWIILELKVLADVGLVGFPNAGKSTLISVLSNAKPKIADYPFTTLRPNLGMVPHRSYQSFVIADIPGIIEGASEGKGLGLRFLRHIERNAILLFLVPCTSENIKKEYTILLNELRTYNLELMDKKRILAITKCDILPDEELNKIEKKAPKDIPVFFISSVSQKNLMPLKDEIWKILNEE